jgi:hypothetical protein
MLRDQMAARVKRAPPAWLLATTYCDTGSPRDEAPDAADVRWIQRRRAGLQDLAIFSENSLALVAPTMVAGLSDRLNEGKADQG